MSVELPKDAEGREIPLDTAMLYDEDGNAQEIIRYDYLVLQIIPSRKWNVITLDHVIHCASDMHLTPPDTWEKLEEDLGRVANCGDSSTPTCAYTRQPCAVCKFHSSENCTSAMCADIESRIHRLRGEGDE